MTNENVCVKSMKFSVYKESLIQWEDVLEVFQDYRKISDSVRIKHEIYYDDDAFSYRQQGKMIKCSMPLQETLDSDIFAQSNDHVALAEPYYEYIKVEHTPGRPYTTEFVLQSDYFPSLESFIEHFKIKVDSELTRVLHAEIRGNVAEFETGQGKVLRVSLDEVELCADGKEDHLFVRLLTVEELVVFDGTHFYDVKELIESRLEKDVKFTRENLTTIGSFIQ